MVPTNSDFILEGRGSEVPRVEALVGKQVYLRSDSGETVTLDVRKGWRSQMARVAVRLHPRGELKPETKYTLMLEQELPGVRNVDPRAASTPFWRTGQTRDRTRPVWSRKPAPAEGRYFFDDNRLNREVRFNLSLKEESPAYVVVTLKRARGKAPLQTYFAPIDGSRIVVGHDGCSGSFTYEDGRAYFAKIEAYDVAGNRGPSLSPIEFHAPKRMAK